jgi:hypothetical protein
VKQSRALDRVIRLTKREISCLLHFGPTCLGDRKAATSHWSMEMAVTERRCMSWIDLGGLDLGGSEDGRPWWAGRGEVIKS